jgi:hypothetical protein
MKNGGTQISVATSIDENKIKSFLKHNDLLHQDITPYHLDHFLLLRDGSKLMGLSALK